MCVHVLRVVFLVWRVCVPSVGAAGLSVMCMWAHIRVAGGGALFAGCVVGYCLLTGLAPDATLGGSTTLQFDKLKFKV